MTTALDPPAAAGACNADGGKVFSPELSAQQLCDRFRSALGAHAGEVRVALRFNERGMASAAAERRRGDGWEALPLVEVSVMDRPFEPADIDRLAAALADLLDR